MSCWREREVLSDEVIASGGTPQDLYEVAAGQRAEIETVFVTNTSTTTAYTWGLKINRGSETWLYRQIDIAAGQTAQVSLRNLPLIAAQKLLGDGSNIAIRFLVVGRRKTA